METFDFRRLEATKLDFKEALETKKAKSWLKSVSAFANTQGGHIIFGVTNQDHEPKGVESAQETISKISQFIRDRISPLPRHTISPIDSGIEGKPCIDVEIQDGPHFPYYYVHEGTKEAYIRHGDRSEVATDYELNNLILRGQNKTFDALPSHYTEADVSFTLFSATYKKETGDELVLPRDLISMNLLDSDGNVTNAGLLLCDQGYLGQSRIVCTRWKGTSKGTIDGDALDDKEFKEESLISLLNGAEAFVRNNSKNPWTIRGMRREENSDYPYKAVREVLVNAMMHRNYQMLGTEIHVDMFDDRMEIVSPGGMISGNRIQDLDLHHVPSMRRNEIISDIFGRLHLMDRRGSGIGRILNSYAAFIEKPSFFSNDICFAVILPNRSVAEHAQVTFDMAKAQLSGPKTQLPDPKAQLSGPKTQLPDPKAQLSEQRRDLNSQENYWELEFFKEVVLPRAQLTFRKKTKEGLICLFERYRYRYEFNRRNVSDVLAVSENRASNIIRECLEKGLIEKEKKDVYRFVDGSTSRNE